MTASPRKKIWRRRRHRSDWPATAGARLLGGFRAPRSAFPRGWRPLPLQRDAAGWSRPRCRRGHLKVIEARAELGHALSMPLPDQWACEYGTSFLPSAAIAAAFGKMGAITVPISKVARSKGLRSVNAWREDFLPGKFCRVRQIRPRAMPI